uniref:Phosphatidylinositol transfer protein n=1 Tax=Panagrolaimus superbus TaxID=310955 RepID=A0A914YH36_9BILA
MIIKEYRILLPLEVEKYQNGQLWSVAEASKQETGGGEGVEILQQETFTSFEVRPGHNLSGIYAHKLYHLKSKMPWIVRKLLPDSAMILDEESWNAYPYCKTILTNPGYMKKDFYIIVETMHVQDDGTSENVLNVSNDILQQREVVVLDIYQDGHLNKKTDIKPDTNPRTFKSIKTGRGPLTVDWSKTTKPVMCCYKLVTAYFRRTGCQGKIENFIHGSYPRLFIKFHRELFCWIDKWYDLTMEDIRKHEKETAENLRKQIKNGKSHGMYADSCFINPLFEEKEYLID